MNAEDIVQQGAVTAKVNHIIAVLEGDFYLCFLCLDQVG